MALAAYTDIEAWIGKTFDSSRQAEVTNCIAFAQSWIANNAGLRSLEKESAVVTEYIDGDKLTDSDAVWLPMSCRPAWHTGSDLVTVVENGTSLTVAIGYTTTAGVSLSGVNTFDRVRLARIGGWSWSTGVPNNIAVAMKCGFDTTTTASTNPCPVAVKRLVMDVAWNMLNSTQRTAKASQSKAGSSVSFKDDLSQLSQDTLDWLRGI